MADSPLSVAQSLRAIYYTIAGAQARYAIPTLLCLVAAVYSWYRPSEHLRNLYLAYSLAWLIFVLYAWSISHRQERLRRELEDMKHKLHAGGNGDAEG